MSDIMFYGVLRMPYELAMSDEISRLQFYQRAQEAADRLEQAEAAKATSVAMERANEQRQGRGALAPVVPRVG